MNFVWLLIAFCGVCALLGIYFALRNQKRERARKAREHIHRYFRS